MHVEPATIYGVGSATQWVPGQKVRTVDGTAHHVALDVIHANRRGHTLYIYGAR